MTAAIADTRVAAWPSLSREPGSIYRLTSGGVLVETGGSWPTWRTDVDAALDLLHGLGIRPGPVVDFEIATP